MIRYVYWSPFVCRAFSIVYQSVFCCNVLYRHVYTSSIPSTMFLTRYSSSSIFQLPWIINFKKAKSTDLCKNVKLALPAASLRIVRLATPSHSSLSKEITVLFLDLFSLFVFLFLFPCKFCYVFGSYRQHKTNIPRGESFARSRRTHARGCDHSSRLITDLHTL